MDARRDCRGSDAGEHRFRDNAQSDGRRGVLKRAYSCHERQRFRCLRLRVVGEFDLTFRQSRLCRRKIGYKRVLPEYCGRVRAQGHSLKRRLPGLDPHARYRFTHDWQQREVSGEYLMNRGLRLWLQGDYASSVIRFDRITEPTG